MDLFKSYATDETAEVNGVWQKGSGNSEFLVARAGNRKYQRLVAKMIEDNQDVLESKTDEADIRSEEIMATIYAETILLGWRGDVKAKGVDLPYTRENAIAMLKLKEFRKWVQKRSDDLDAYRAKIEGEQGNA